MPPAANKYSIDSSSLIFAWTEAYPMDAFASFWTRLDKLTEDGRLFLSEEVHEELKKKDDGLHKWVKARSGLIVSHSDDVQAETSKVLASHRLLLNARKGRSGADAFVIGLAMARGLTVVTQEEKSNSTKAPRIPDVCDAYRLPCKPILAVIREEGWTF